MSKRTRWPKARRAREGHPSPPPPLAPPDFVSDVDVEDKAACFAARRRFVPWLNYHLAIDRVDNVALRVTGDQVIRFADAFLTMCTAEDRNDPAGVADAEARILAITGPPTPEQAAALIADNPFPGLRLFDLWCNLWRVLVAGTVVTPTDSPARTDPATSVRPTH